MRLSNIETKFKISIPYNQPDLNGNVYSKNAIINAFSESLDNLPLTDIDGNKIIGSLTGSKIVNETDSFIEVELTAKINHGGTCEMVNFYDAMVRDYQVTSFGIGE